jgi:hypothetical protein
MRTCMCARYSMFLTYDKRAAQMLALKGIAVTKTSPPLHLLERHGLGLSSAPAAGLRRNSKAGDASELAMPRLRRPPCVSPEFHTGWRG